MCVNIDWCSAVPCIHVASTRRAGKYHRSSSRGCENTWTCHLRQISNFSELRIIKCDKYLSADDGSHVTALQCLSHRSHFGSRYKLGCCGHGGIFVFPFQFSQKAIHRANNTQAPQNLPESSHEQQTDRHSRIEKHTLPKHDSNNGSTSQCQILLLLLATFGCLELCMEYMPA